MTKENKPVHVYVEKDKAFDIIEDFVGKVYPEYMDPIVLGKSNGSSTKELYKKVREFFEGKEIPITFVSTPNREDLKIDCEIYFSLKMDESVVTIGKGKNKSNNNNEEGSSFLVGEPETVTWGKGLNGSDLDVTRGKHKLPPKEEKLYLYHVERKRLPETDPTFSPSDAEALIGSFVVVACTPEEALSYHPTIHSYGLSHLFEEDGRFNWTAFKERRTEFGFLMEEYGTIPTPLKTESSILEDALIRWVESPEELDATKLGTADNEKLARGSILLKESIW